MIDDFVYPYITVWMAFHNMRKKAVSILFHQLLCCAFIVIIRNMLCEQEGTTCSELKLAHQ